MTAVRIVRARLWSDGASLAGDATVVTLTMTDGTKLSRRIDHCIGSAINPMTNADLEDKFVGLSEPVVGATRTREIVAKTWDVAALADAGELARACA